MVEQCLQGVARDLLVVAVGVPRAEQGIETLADIADEREAPRMCFRGADLGCQVGDMRGVAAALGKRIDDGHDGIVCDPPGIGHGSLRRSPGGGAIVSQPLETCHQVLQAGRDVAGAGGERAASLLELVVEARFASAKTLEYGEQVAALAAH